MGRHKGWFKPGNQYGRLLKGFPKSEEWKRKASLAKMGDRNPMRNPVHARKMALSKKGKPNPKMREFWRLHKDEQIRKMMVGAARKRPNRLEQKLIEIIRRNDLPFRYVGNWQLVLGGKCPDFLKIGGQRQLLELFGNYWHTLKARESITQRKAHFRQFGFDTLVIWEDELKDEAGVIRKIRSFGGD